MADTINEGMNKNTLRQDILAHLHTRKIKLHRLALESGVDGKSLWLFMNREEANLNTDSLFRLWPHIYGGQSPASLTTQKSDGHPEAESAKDAPLPKPDSDLLALCLVILSFGSDVQKQALVSLAESTLQAKTTSPAEGEES